MRRAVKNKRGDKRYFRLTAQKTKMINVPVKVSRGGIRL